MVYCDMFKIIILLLIGVVSAIALPAHLYCCSPDLGVFVDPTNESSYCLKEQKRNPLSLTCLSHNTFTEDVLNLIVTDSGQVYFINPIEGESEEMKRGEVCFANYTDSNNNENKVVALCNEEEEGETVLASCLAVSAVFLLLTTVLYAVLPEIRDLQGISLINFCGSMGIGLTILSISKLISYSDMTFCAIRGFLTYFFLIAGFFWSNAISIQMLLCIGRPAANNFGWKKICWYAIYAWGCPTLLTICMVVVNYHPGDHKRPGIGLNTCWFYNTSQQWYYMYSIMSILIVVNICIFIYTFIQLCRLSFSSTQTKALRYKCVMCVRMFLIMGISWIFEMISSLTEKSVVWFIIDVFNALQGPLIFLLLVVFRKRVMMALLKRGYLLCLAGPFERYMAAKEDDEEGVLSGTGDGLNEMSRVERDDN